MNKDGTNNIYHSTKYIGSATGATAAAITSATDGRVAIARLGSATTFDGRSICGTESNAGILSLDAEL